jgi:hypothetical protein
MTKPFAVQYWYDTPQELREMLNGDLERYESLEILAMTTVVKYYGWRILGIKTYVTTVVMQYAK